MSTLGSSNQTHDGMQQNSCSAQGCASVDVVITCYNEGLFIKEAVQSVLAQTASTRIASIVVVDDGSDSETIKVLENIRSWDPRISVYFGPGGNRLPAQRNLAIGKCSGPYIAILDGDDIWEPEKLELQIAVLDRDKKIGLVYSDYYTFADGDPDSYRRVNAIDLSTAENQTRAYFLNDPPIVPSTTVFRRTAFEESGGFDEHVKLFEDTDLWIRMSRVSRFGFVDTPLTRKRYHRSSLTGASLDVMQDHATIALKAVLDDPELLKYVPRRLAERARKLGNQHYILANPAAARKLLKLSLDLYPFSPRTWASFLVVWLIPNLSYRLLNSNLQTRRRALGIHESQ
ncbi:glycosyltransferase family 2 protein [Ruegeria arenilitoris]|uniref:glycosyltransferase family 2 protein n=1 Tax=Ruegeria arenilitoris TaxID=1173585 RepID=UPI00147FB8C1|nr:glycosyltransferase family 2 protein [Ruegeria arenilitoris]